MKRRRAKKKEDRYDMIFVRSDTSVKLKYVYLHTFHSMAFRYLFFTILSASFVLFLSNFLLQTIKRSNFINLESWLCEGKYTTLGASVFRSFQVIHDSFKPDCQIY